MKTTARYKAISVTVPAAMERALSDVCAREIRKKSEVVQEALRLYFHARSGRPGGDSLHMPSGRAGRKHTDLSAFFSEWSSELDSVYDSLARK